MNEQQLADELGTLIDNRIENVAGGLSTEDVAFAARLLILRDQTHADTAFANALEARLKAASDTPFRNRRPFLNRGLGSHPDMRFAQGRLVYTMATVAAALVIVVFAALTVPSLQTLTQNPPATQTAMIAPTAPVEARAAAYVLASAPLSSSFRIMGRALYVNDLAVSLAESALTSYVDLLASVDNDTVSSS